MHLGDASRDDCFLSSSPDNNWQFLAEIHCQRMNKKWVCTAFQTLYPWVYLTQWTHSTVHYLAQYISVSPAQLHLYQFTGACCTEHNTKSSGFFLLNLFFSLSQAQEGIDQADSSSVILSQCSKETYLQHIVLWKRTAVHHGKDTVDSRVGPQLGLCGTGSGKG